MCNRYFGQWSCGHDFIHVTFCTDPATMSPRKKICKSVTEEPRNMNMVCKLQACTSEAVRRREAQQEMQKIKSKMQETIKRGRAADAKPSPSSSSSTPVADLDDAMLEPIAYHVESDNGKDAAEGETNELGFVDVASASNSPSRTSFEPGERICYCYLEGCGCTNPTEAPYLRCEVCKYSSNVDVCVRGDHKLDTALADVEMRLNGGPYPSWSVDRRRRALVAAEAAPVLKLTSFVTDEEFDKMY